MVLTAAHAAASLVTRIGLDRASLKMRTVSLTIEIPMTTPLVTRSWQTPVA